MSDNRSKDHRFNDQLAEFTDQALQRERSEPLPLSAEDEELRQLQQLVVRLKQAGLADRAEVKSAAQMRAALLQEWLRSGPQTQEQKKRPAIESSGPLARIRHFLGRIFNAPGRRLALTAAVLALAILILLPGNNTLTASAGTQTAFRPVGLGIGILCLGALIWLLVKNRD